MPILDCYVDDDTMKRLEVAGAELGASAKWCAEAAISEAALNAFRHRPNQDPAKTVPIVPDDKTQGEARD